MSARPPASAARRRASPAVRRAVAVSAALLVACRGQEKPPGLGRRVVEGEALGLRASADGSALAVLRGCEPVKDRTLPPGTARCDLDVAVDGAAPRRVARRVSTLPSALAWSAAGRTLAALADHDHARGEGALTIWSGGAPARVAEGVSFYAVDAGGRRVGWVSGGRLSVLDLARGGAPAPLADGIATFEFGPDAAPVLARRTARDGGALLAILAGARVEIAPQVRDYGYARDGGWYAFTWGAAKALSVAPAGSRPGAPLGRDVQLFLFAPRGDALAFLADAAPGRQGDLWATAAAGARASRLASRAGEPRWSADGARLAWLQDYDPRSRTGTLAVGAPGAAPSVVARNVSDFDLSADGGQVAYLVHETAGGYSVDLGLARAGAPAAKVARGVFGFSFSPDAAWLYYRAGCVREAEACDLLRVRADGAAPGAAPERIAEGVKSFEYAPGRPDRLLVTWARKDRVALDLAIWDGGRLVAVDTYALPGSAQFLGSDPRRLAYVVVDPKRPGAYVAEVP